MHFISNNCKTIFQTTIKMLIKNQLKYTIEINFNVVHRICNKQTKIHVENLLSNFRYQWNSKSIKYNNKTNKQIHYAINGHRFK